MAERDLARYPTASILGNAPSIRALRDQIQQLASFDTIGNPRVPTLLLQGETGTGKGLVARVTHESGPRASNPFIEINCAAIPETLLEAELFGFDAGAFTDARRAKPGLFEAASSGTLFLDDVDALPMSLQGKFLKVIEEKWVRRLGSVTDHQVDVKIIAATQEDLQVHIGEGRFRADLYHRLAVVMLAIPPLRERTEDIVLLAQHFLRSCAEAHGLVSKQLGQTAEKWLLGYSWPGNVRQLSHLMERATLLGSEPILEAQMLESLSLNQLSPPTQPNPTGVDPESEALEEPAKIREALTRTGGNVVQAARLLGLGRNALRYRMRRYGIEAPNLGNDGQGPSLETKEDKTAPLPGSRGGEPPVVHQTHVPRREDPATTLLENLPAKLGTVLRDKGKAAMATVAALLVGIAALLTWNSYRDPVPASGVAPAKQNEALAIAEKPSIAVLAFSNMSGDADQEYVGDGLADNIITRLAGIPEMLVIARNSSFTYKDNPVKVQQVGRELGVNYVLEGAVQKDGERIRVSAQLIDAATGEHLWAESYDRELKDIFAIQDEITLEIIKSLQVKLTHGENSVVTKHATDNVRAWEASVQGWSHYRRFTKAENARARELWQNAIELDPDFALAYTLLGFTHLMDSIRRWGDDRKGSLGKAEQLAQKTLAMDDSIPDAHALLSRVYMSRKQFEKALAEAERSMALDPNNPNVLAIYAHQSMLLGRPQESVRALEKAMRVHPTNRPSLVRLAGRVYYFAGRYDKAIAASRQYLERDPKRTSPRVILIASLVAEGQEEEARSEATALVERRPKYSITKAHSKRGFFHSFKDPQHWELLVARLQQAGLPE